MRCVAAWCVILRAAQLCAASSDAGSRSQSAVAEQAVSSRPFLAWNAVARQNGTFLQSNETQVEEKERKEEKAEELLAWEAGMLTKNSTVEDEEELLAWEARMLAENSTVNSTSTSSSTSATSSSPLTTSSSTSTSTQPSSTSTSTSVSSPNTKTSSTTSTSTSASSVSTTSTVSTVPLTQSSTSTSTTLSSILSSSTSTSTTSSQSSMRTTSSSTSTSTTMSSTPSSTSTRSTWSSKSSTTSTVSTRPSATSTTSTSTTASSITTTSTSTSLTSLTSSSTSVSTVTTGTTGSSKSTTSSQSKASSSSTSGSSQSSGSSSSTSGSTTSTSETTTAAPVVAASGDSGGGGGGAVIGIVVGVLVALLLCCCAGGGFFMWRMRKQEKEETERRLRVLEKEEEVYQENHMETANAMEIYRARVKEASDLPTNFQTRKHQEFLSAWDVYAEKHRAFTDGFVAWRDGVRRGRLGRGAAAKPAAAAPPAGTSAGKGGGKGGGKAAPPPGGPSKQQSTETSPSNVTDGSKKPLMTANNPPKARNLSPMAAMNEQRRILEEVRNRLMTLSKEFQNLMMEVSQILDQAAVLPELDFGDYGSKANVKIEEQVDVLKDFAHPLLARFAVKPYGVLGSSDKTPDPKPLSPVDAVVVDPAGWTYIGHQNNSRNAGGASASIYSWLDLAKQQHRFPADVHRHFDMAEPDAERLAKLWQYRDGQTVIHVIGPKVAALLEGVHDLSVAYKNVLSEYCMALAVAEGGGNSNSNSKAGPPAADVVGKPLSMPTMKSIPKTLRLLPISSGIFLQEKRLEPHMPQITWAAISMALVMLPLEAQQLLKSCSVEVCIFQQRQVQSYTDSLSSKLAALGSSGEPGKLMELQKVPNQGTAPKKAGNHDWLRTKNGPVDRLQRLATCLTTQQAIWCGGYIPVGGGEAQLKAVSEMLAGTVVKRASDQAPPANTSGARVPEILWDEKGTTMEVAGKMASQGRKTVAVNAASAYQVGGGALTGGRHAQEETWCTMSTLLKSLQKVHWQQVRLTGGGQGNTVDQHIPVDGCIVSPKVQIFRDTSGKGYAFLPVPTTLHAVCSMAMFNQNSAVRDSPLDSPQDFETYCTQVRRKFRAVIETTAELKAEVLVTSDVGCGVFENDPVVVGTLFGEVLRENAGHLQEVVVTGKKEFSDAVRKAAASSQRIQLQPPAYFLQDHHSSAAGHPRREISHQSGHSSSAAPSTQASQSALPPPAVVPPPPAAEHSAKPAAGTPAAPVSSPPQPQQPPPSDPKGDIPVVPGKTVPGAEKRAPQQTQQGSGGGPGPKRSAK
mmetsp:Transcript_48388/g.115050  ORF Transcript_48388/g.115050 Transcript_48388/m.115050 type:complete len:1301 (+) Transcript_48388:108-4010(+)